MLTKFCAGVVLCASLAACSTGNVAVPSVGPSPTPAASATPVATATPSRPVRAQRATIEYVIETTPLWPTDNLDLYGVSET